MSTARPRPISFTRTLDTGSGSEPKSEQHQNPKLVLNEEVLEQVLRYLSRVLHRDKHEYLADDPSFDKCAMFPCRMWNDMNQGNERLWKDAP